MPHGQTTYEHCVQQDGTVLMWGTEPMIVPTGSPHVRQCSLFLPPLPKNNALTATVYSSDSSGTMFVMWSIKKIYEKDHTQFGISAANVQIGHPSDFSYFIDWQVTAKVSK